MSPAAPTPRPDFSNIPELAGFWDYLRVEKGLSANTLATYRRDLDSWLVHVVRDGRVPAWDQIDTRQIRAFVRAHLRSKAPATQARFLSSLRQFFHYLRLQNRVSANPVDAISAPRQAKPLPKTLAAEVLVAWIGELAESAEGADIRDAAILATLYGCGLRVAEMVALDQDADLDALRVRGKGNKERIVPVPARTTALIERWRSVRQSWVRDQESALFTNQRGGRLTTRGVQDILRRRAKALPGTSDQLTPHVMRHSYATDLLLGGVDLRAIQELLGHASLTTTQRYTHLDFAALAKTYDQAHPRS